MGQMHGISGRTFLVFLGILLACLLVGFLFTFGSDGFREQHKEQSADSGAEPGPTAADDLEGFGSRGHVDGNNPSGVISTGQHERDPMLVPLDNEIYSQSQRDFYKGMYERKYSDPREFVKQRWISGLPYGQVQHLIKVDSLGMLYTMLKEPGYSKQWTMIAAMICFISDDPNSLGEVIDYVQRSREESFDGFDVVGKSKILMWVGLIPGAASDSLLRATLGEDGAKRLAQAWIESTEYYSDTLSRERLIGLIRGSAAVGLVHAQRKDGIALVEQLYREEHVRCKKNRHSTEFYHQLVSAMAIRDLIGEIGMSQYLHLQGTQHNRLSPYLRKYSWYLAEMAAKGKIVE